MVLANLPLTDDGALPRLDGMEGKVERNRLTEAEAQETIKAARVAERVKATIWRQWLGGDPGARFAVWNLRQRLIAEGRV